MHFGGCALFILTTMASEPTTAATTAITPMSNSTQIIDSLDGRNTQTQSQSWWLSGGSAAGRAVSMGERDDAAAASVHGRRCVLTGSRDGVELCHLLAKSMSKAAVCDLQYSFGRKLNINSRWFLLHVVSQFHHSFDNGCNWALIPEPSTITSIAEKMRAENERRLQLSITGPWPDYRQRDWFPITGAGFACHLIPLGIANPEADSIYRRRDMDDPDAPPRATQQFDPPSYEGFPTLRLHVHPYALIVNAQPKLEIYLQTWELPAPANSSYDNIKYIYDILTKSAQQVRALTSRQRVDSRGSRGSRGSTTHPASARYHLRSREQSQSASQTTHSHPGSALQDNYDDSVDSLDSNPDGPQDSLGMNSHNSFSDLTSDHRDLLESKAHCSSSLHPSSMVLEQKGVTEWVASVEYARGQNVLVEPQDDSSPETSKYTTEPARTSPTLDWHGWESAFAPWTIPLPEYKERGVLSSNDWVEIKNLPPLPRRLDFE
ncbi:hypothetical protein RSOL_225190 [Rhizoctonia solani AG-3 Rhs1AP]|uniref:HNH nuclease domain-containing protein n=2 Tax=Rhizoctonia solani AG-3 TaxID=1086053 RepID=A0A074RJ35_9AGAM|nr:hypothetical protein RSOL_225190 [Rhizoctonia solani AG-3 Rhs1AP]KEP46794.1 hypothetical protein V565_181430 [Rhizoctonia solani 123E]